MSGDQQTPPSPPTGEDGGPAAEAPQEVELTAEQLHQLVAADTFAKLVALCGLFAPHVMRAENGREELEKLAINLATEQLKIRDEVIPLFFAPESLRDHPFFGTKLYHHNNPNNAPALIQGPKRLMANQPAHLTFQTLATIMFLMQPEYRGLLRIFGIRYEFIQAHPPADKPRIQLASSLPPGGRPNGRGRR